MNIFERARFLMFGDLPKSALRPGAQDPLARIIISALGLGRQPLWTPKRYDQLSEAGYQNCMTVYACVNQITRAAAGIEWREYDGEKEVANPAVIPLLRRPNENEAKRAFVTKHFGYMLLSGNSFLIAGRIGSAPPLALWLARPDRMKVLPGTGGQKVRGYRYTVAGLEQDFDFGQVLHTRLFHPTNDFYGLSPLEVASNGIDVVNMSAEWNMRVLQNDMRPPGALSTEGSLTPDQFATLKKMMQEEWAGFENAGVPLLLEGGLKWVSFAFTPKELDWLNSTKVTKRDIAAVFNIDPCLVGDAEYATYANKQEARKGLYLETVLPLMEEFRDDLNLWLSPMFGEKRWIDINRDKIEALQEEREKKFTYLENCSFMRLNEKRTAVGLEPVGKEGEVILIPIGKIPLELAAEGNEPDDGADQDPDEDDNEKARRFEREVERQTREAKTLNGLSQSLSRLLSSPYEVGPDGHLRLPARKSFWADPERKKRLWHVFEARVKAREKTFEQIAKAYIRAQAEGVRQRASRLGSLSSLYGADIFSVKDEAKRYGKTFWAWYIDHFIRAGNAGMTASKGELFDDAEFKAMARKDDPGKPDSWVFHLTQEQEDELRRMVFESGTRVSETTLEIINDMIRQANAESWTVADFAGRLADKLADFGPWRSRMWARTESAKVDNWGQVEGYKQTEFVERKGWGSSFTPESRDAHMAADGTEVPVDGTFSVDGDELRYPGDPRGKAGNVINCLCFTYPVV